MRAEKGAPRILNGHGRAADGVVRAMTSPLRLSWLPAGLPARTREQTRLPDCRVAQSHADLTLIPGPAAGSLTGRTISGPVNAQLFLLKGPAVEHPCRDSWARRAAQLPAQANEQYESQRG